MSIESVKAFHDKFGLPDGADNNLTPEAFEFRVGFMQEELDEFVRSINSEDFVGGFDALLDLAYVVFGTALFMGVDTERWNAGMEAVHQANMTKIRARDRAESKRGTTLDVIKPEGWVAPEEKLAEILAGNFPRLCSKPGCYQSTSLPHGLCARHEQED